MNQDEPEGNPCSRMQKQRCVHGVLSPDLRCASRKNKEMKV